MANIVLVSDIDLKARRFNSTDMRIISLAQMLVNNHSVTVHTPKGLWKVVNGDTLKYEPLSYNYTKQGNQHTLVIIALTRWSIRTAENIYCSAKQRIIDLYCPRILENTFQNYEGLMSNLEKRLSNQFEIYLVKRAINLGTGFLVANTRQRDWVFGLMTAQGVFFDRPYLRDYPNKYVRIVPLLLKSNKNVSKARARKYISQLCNIDLDSKFLIVWSGGWHEWLDIETVIQALIYVCGKYKDVRAVFGARSSNNVVSSKIGRERIESIHKQLRTTPEIVTLESWIPFGEHSNLIIAADLSIVCAEEHIEDHLSHRTRAIESLRYQVPLIINKNNILSDDRADRTYPVDAGNVFGVIRAIELARQRWQENRKHLDNSSKTENIDQVFLDACAELEGIVSLSPGNEASKNHGAIKCIGRCLDITRRIARAINKISVQ